MEISKTMIIEANLIDYILQLEPDFLEPLEELKNSWSLDKSKLTIGIQFIEFSDFVSGKFRNGSYPNAKKIFDSMEFLLEDQNSDEKVQTLVTTCFLENMQNQSSNGAFSPSLFVPLLGPKSREYCKAWDEFTGVATPGLWSNDKPNFRTSKPLIGDEEALRLISKIRSTEDRWSPEIDQLVKILETSFSGISNLLFYDRRDLSPKEILQEAKKEGKSGTEP